MSRNNIFKFLMIVITGLFLTSCDMVPNVIVWLQRVDFEVDSKANASNPFVCHIVIAYSKDLCDKLQGIDSKGYFSSVNNLKKTYKDSIEIFSYDIIPGKNKLNQEIKPRSYSNAKGAFIFAKYTTQGRFAENIGMARNLVVRFLPYKMELHPDISFESLTAKLNRD